VDVAHLRFARW